MKRHFGVHFINVYQNSTDFFGRCRILSESDGKCRFLSVFGGRWRFLAGIQKHKWLIIWLLTCNPTLFLKKIDVFSKKDLIFQRTNRTRMTLIRRINTDLIRENLFNPFNPCAIVFTNINMVGTCSGMFLYLFFQMACICLKMREYIIKLKIMNLAKIIEINILWSNGVTDVLGIHFPI